MTSRLETTGLILIVVSLFIGIQPFIMFGRGSTPEFQAYQDAKGSWIPFGFANEVTGQFLIGAGIIGFIGAILVVGSRLREKRRLKKSLGSRRP